MSTTAACGGHRSRSHGRADVRTRPRAGPRQRALARRRRTVVAAATLAFAALAWSPSSQALQAVSSTGPGAARALAESTGPAGSDESVGGAGAVEEAGVSADGTRPRTDALRRVVMAEDDTLWSLARAHAPSGTHPSVYARVVMEVNDVEDPRRLRAGEVLWLPLR